ncbi:hypothetical protein ACWOFR_00960 [Carnobacterium gallinarum]|uniref:hypothetical protein n=1 Tax=Carnobacterium gallinarum TaxID=2749 RepID=UPI00068F721D|nr:hypothetical protein [Carnobacterium gallinarum]
MKNKVYDYIKHSYLYDDPILTDDLLEQFPEIRKGTMRQILKRLCDDGVLKRATPGVFYFPNPKSILKSSVVSISNIISEKYLYKNNEIIGYRSGINFANKLGLTTQTASIETIVSNEVSDKKRIVRINNTKIIVVAPRVKVTAFNYKLLQVLDLLYNFEQYSESNEYEAKRYLIRYLEDLEIAADYMEHCVSKYPLSTQVKFYKLGVYHEITRG